MGWTSQTRRRSPTFLLAIILESDVATIPRVEDKAITEIVTVSREPR